VSQFSVYILKCADGSYYTGHTEDLERRIAAHARGDIGGYTSSRRPLQLIWSEQFASRAETIERERQVKGWSRAKKEALIQQEWGALPQLAANRMEHSPTNFDPTRVRAVAFDGYGTLFDYGMSHFRLEVASILVEQQIDVDLDEFFPTWQRSYRLGDVWDQRDRDEHGPTGWPTDRALNGPLPSWHSQWEIWRRQFQAALDHHHLDGDATAAANRFRQALSDADAYPETHDAIETLATRGYLLGLLSNADEDFLQSAVSRARLRFSVIQSSESLRAYKPHRAIFMALSDRFGVAPDEILYVGDSPYADVAGGMNAGLATAWIRRDETALPAHLSAPHLTIAQLTELLDVLG